MLATERLSQIEAAGADLIERIVPLDLDEQTLRIILYLRDGSNLRITEQWNGTVLLRYSYYWLTEQNELQIAWDNVPHHRHIATYPHHKHVERQDNIQESQETVLEAVLAHVREQVE